MPLFVKELLVERRPVAPLLPICKVPVELMVIDPVAAEASVSIRNVPATTVVLPV